jgi:predicted O-linked N-acetylglucosamine transferase (SPINDLY family)
MLTLPQAMQQASAAYRGGEWGKAEQWCRLVIEAQPDYFDALNLLGIIAARTQHPKEAAELLQRAVAANPADAAARNNYGNVLRELQRFDEALECYERALGIQPEDADTLYNRGVTLLELRRSLEALESFDRALELNRGLAPVHFSRGNALQELGRIEESLESYERALQIDPAFAEARNNRGNALHQLRRFGDALESYDRALGINPKLAEAHVNRGNALQELQRYGDAVESYGRALKIRPDLADAYISRANALQRLGRFSEAIDGYHRALGIRPDAEWAYGNWLIAKMHLCDWNGFDAAVAEMSGRICRKERAAEPYSVLTLTDSLPVQRQAAETWVNAAHPTDRRPPSTARGERHGRIRVGYFSADYYNHATAYLMAGLFESHHRERFELVAFSFGPDRHDEMRARLSGAFDRFIDVRTRSDREIAELSRELEIDIAVDLKGYTQNHRAGIFAHAAAPIQVNYLGFPGTMGARYIDYILADATVIPVQSMHHYSEKVVHLPNSYYPTSYRALDPLQTDAAREFSRVELGLPPTGFVFCCFNNHIKITPDTFGGWMRILEKTPGSILWLFEANGTAIDYLRREAERHGVSGARLVFARRMSAADHLRRHRLADLFLDTLPYNAHTTATDALWTGLPVLTLMGESFAARVAGSLLNALNLPELIANTREQYEAMAIELASNPGRLAQLRERLAANKSTAPLFDTTLLTRHIERAYEQMYERHQAGLAPAHISVA